MSATLTETIPTEVTPTDASVNGVATETKPAKAKKAKSTTKARAPKVKAPKAKSDKKPGRAKKEGLRKMQLRALDVLSDPKNKDGLPLALLAKKAKISDIVMRRGLGPIDPACRDAHNEFNGFRCLLSLGHVRVQKREFDGETDTIYAITASGMKAMGKYDDEIKNLGKPQPAPFSVHTPEEVAKLKKAEAKAAKKAK